MTEVLYRKYRPKKLEEVVGQDHVTTALANALKDNGVVNALLFAGPRGTGKTSVARILAEGLGVEGVDLIEIDAASNRGIDKIREIRDTVSYQPTQSPNKLYILDEVHMLTTDAFNALLKTLEEPPHFVYFVLCTTEPYKIPLTIISRCQRFDFKPAQDSKVVDLLMGIAEKEGVQIEKEAAELIAENSGNSFRDSLVLLQKSISHSGSGILNPSGVREGLGLLDDVLFEKAYTFVAHGAAYEFLSSTRLVADSGVSLAYFVDRIIERLVLEITSTSVDSKSSVSSGESLIGILNKMLEARRKMNYSTNSLAALISVFDNGSVPQTSVSTAKEELNVNAEAPVKEMPVVEEPQETIPPEKSDASVNWDVLLAKVKEKKQSVETLLRAGKISEIMENELVLAFNYAFHKEKLQESSNKMVVEEALAEIYGKRFNLRCQLNESTANTDAVWDIPNSANIPVVVDEGRAGSASEQRAPRRSNDDDLLAIARDVFGGQLIE